MGSRRAARRLAVLAFYQADVLDETLGERLATVLALEGADAGQADYAGHVVELYSLHHAAVDRALREAGARWDLDRMSATDRAVLRVAATELLLEPEIPHAVVLNEAIEIAKRYGDIESGRFVNGVLDAVRRRLVRTAGESAEDLAGSDDDREDTEAADPADPPETTEAGESGEGRAGGTG
ncbi:MAG: transcription antitermination factor NusB [Candidatus Eiseniibacteriota bacterium]|jgi:N utilization substance protein B